MAKNTRAPSAMNWYSQYDFSGGINYNKERALANQVLDSRNMWALNGPCVQRPGYEWASCIGQALQYAGPLALDCIVYDDSAATYTNYLGTAVTFDGASNDILYISHSTVDGTPGSATGTALQAIFWDRVTANTNDVRLKAQYWNGTRWAKLPYLHGGVVQNNYYMFDFYSGSRFMRKPAWATPTKFGIFFDIPADIATSSVNSTSRKWIRFITKDASSSISPAINAETLYKYYVQSTTGLVASNITGAFSFQWNTGDECLVTCGKASATNTRGVSGITVGPSLAQPILSGAASTTVDIITSWSTGRSEETSLTVIPEFNEAYIAASGRVLRIKKDFLYRNASTTANDVPGTNLSFKSGTNVGTEPNLAQIENRTEFTDLMTGVTLESSWPESSYLLWANGFLFAANIKDSPYEIRWSAETKFGKIGYKMWPKTSRTFAVGSDLSPITGMSQFSEHPLIFKRDSLWRMVYQGVDAQGVNIWESLRVDGAVGTVSHNSIKPLPPGIAYAYEDGIYLFDGVRSTKISAPIDKFWNTLRKSQRYSWNAAHWREKHCYLLSVSTSESDNVTHVIVWDYQNNTWWIWDNIEANRWIMSKDPYGKEDIYFLDRYGRIFQLGGTTDRGAAMDRWIDTHRFGYKDEIDKRFRAVNVWSTNHAKTVAVTLISNDKNNVTAATVNFNDVSEPLPAAFKFDLDLPTVQKNRLRTNYFRTDGQFAYVRVRDTTKNTEFELSKLEVGFIRKAG